MAISTPIGHESLTVSSAVKALTAGTYGEAKSALITVETAAIRYTVHGTDPDNSVDGAADVGHQAQADTRIRLQNRHELEAFRAIRSDGSNDATIRVTYGV